MLFAVSSQQFLHVSAIVCSGKSQLRCNKTLLVSVRTHRHRTERMLSREWELVKLLQDITPTLASEIKGLEK